MEQVAIRAKSIVDILITKKPAAIFVTGAAGSGKTTFSKRYRDHIRVIDSKLIRLSKLQQVPSSLDPSTVSLKAISSLAKQQAKIDVTESILLQQSFILSYTGKDIDYMKSTIAEAKRHGFSIGLVRLKVPLELCLQRNAQREKFTNPEHIVDSHQWLDESWQTLVPLVDLSQVIQNYS